MKTLTIQVPDDFKVPEGYEIKIVKKEEEKPVIRTYQDLIDNNIQIEGYWTAGGNLDRWTLDYACFNSMDVAASKKVAKSMLAMAMISQLIKYYGGEITDEEWDDGNITKHVIERIGNDINTDYYSNSFYFLAFHTAEQRDNFLKYNEQLVKDYLMVD